jgi:hypothetical protein
MTNPHLKTRLIQIMEEEKRTKLQLIACIIDHRSKHEPTDEVQLFDSLYDLTLTEINEQYDVIIGDLTDRISKQLEWIDIRFKGD